MPGRLVSILQGDVEKGMERRKEELDETSKKTGKRSTGGLFDIIFRAKKEREQTLKDSEG